MIVATNKMIMNLISFINFFLVQLLNLRKNLKQQEAVEDVMMRLNKLNEIRGGTPKHLPSASNSSSLSPGGVGGAAGGGASTGIWRKLKGGKKKKQRNLTAPEITTQEVAEAASQTNAQNNSTISPVKEHDGAMDKVDVDKKESRKDGGKGKGLFGRKGGKEKSSPDTKNTKRKSRDSTGMGKKDEVVLRNDLAMTPSDSEEVALSQRSDQSLSQASATQADLSSSPALNRASNAIVLEVLDLSQSSGKHPSPSSSLLTSTQAALNENHSSTQSSSDVGIPNSSATPEAGTPHTQDDDRGSSTWDGREDVKGGEGEGGDEDYNEYHSYLQGSASLYKEFGSKQHKLSLKKVQEFLESSNEMKPVDLMLLQDWDGWIVAVREIV